MSIISEPADYLRLVNIALVVANLLVLALRWRAVHHADRSDLLRGQAVVLMVIVIGWGSVETLIDDSPAPGIRTYLWTVVLIWLLLSHRKPRT